MIIDGTIPNNKRNKIAIRSSIGLGCIVRPKNLRELNLYDGKIGFYKINNPLSFLELSKEIIRNIDNKNFLNQLLHSDV